MENVKRLIDGIADKIIRERAVLVAAAVAVLTTIQDSSFSWEEAKILAVGVVIRFLVTPTNEANERAILAQVRGFGDGHRSATRRGHAE